MLSICRILVVRLPLRQPLPMIVRFNHNAGANDPKEKSGQALFEVAKFATSTFVSSFAESLALYTVLFGGGALLLYFGVSMMFNSVNEKIQNGLDRVSKGAEKMREGTNDVLHNEKMRRAVEKGHEIKDKLREIDVTDVVEDIRTSDRVQETIEKGVDLSNIMKRSSEEAIGKIKFWRDKIVNKKE